MTQLGIKPWREDEEIKPCADCGQLLVESQLDRGYCSNCIDNHLITCSDCGEVTVNPDDDNFVEYNQSWYCRNCFDQSFCTCANCNDIITQDDSRYCETCEQTLCSSCLDLNHITCIDCGETICQRNELSYTTYNNGIICESCLQNGYHKCSDCGDLFPDGMLCYNENDECDYCESCAERHNTSRYIHDYGYKPYAQYHGEQGPFIGIELEVESKGDTYCDEEAEYLVDHYSDNENLFYIKSDGSLDNGMEIVSHPCIIEFHKSQFPWSNVLSHLRDSGFKSHDTKTCGLHLHLSRASLTKSEQIKLGIFVNMQIENMEVLGRRKNNSYAKFKDLSKNGLKYAAENDEGRYEALNWNNSRTVEFRFPKGTLKIETLLATIELVDSLAKWVKTVSTPQVCQGFPSWLLYRKFVQANGYKILDTYITSKLGGLICV